MENHAFDILVVGSGVYGSSIACVAAAQGLDVALIDKGDFGHATSANSQKIIHGGLRYLQHCNLKRMRESIRARRQLMKFAPHLVRPLQCIVPTHGYGLRSRAVLAVALGLNDLVSWDRNRGLDRQNMLPRGHMVSAAHCLKMIPGLDPSRISGGALWYDAMAVSTERLTLSFVAAAAAEGATVANYVKASEFLFSKASVQGVRATDILAQRDFEIRSNLVVNAAGPWAGELADTVPGSRTCMPSSWSLATNVVVNRRLFGDYAVGLSAGEYVDLDAVFRKRTRDLFFVPWRDGTIIGTFYTPFSGDAESCQVGARHLARMLEEINNAYPNANLELDDVCSVHGGLLPMARGSESSCGDIQLMKRPLVVHSEASGSLSGLLSLVGVKYTTAPEVAKHVVKAAMAKLGRRWVLAAEPQTERAPPQESELSVTAKRLWTLYGTKLSAVMKYCSTDEGQRPVAATQPTFSGEVTYAVREEMARRLSDVVFRRTELGTFGYPGREALKRCAGLMSRELGWTPDRMRSEIDFTEQAYSTLVEAGCLELGRNDSRKCRSNDRTAAPSTTAGEW